MPEPTEIDLDALEAQAKAQLIQCGPCDFGLVEYGCNCPKGDPRPVISQLVELIAEVRKLRAANIELAISNDALAFQANAAASPFAATAGRADLDAFERLIGSLTAELRLLRDQRQLVLAHINEIQKMHTIPGGDFEAVAKWRPADTFDAIRAIFAGSSQGEGGEPK